MLRRVARRQHLWESARSMTRRAYGLLALAAIAFAIYVSLIPFRFQPVPTAVAVKRFDAVMRAEGREWTSRTNFIANILLFVPVGFALTGALALDRGDRSRTAVLLAVLPISLAASLTAEFLQVFVPGRIVSRSDVVAQTLGAIMGFGAWAVAGQPLTSVLRKASERHRTDRLARALGAYACGWVFVNLAPFDATFDLGALRGRYRDGLINPFPLAHAGSTPAFVWDAAITALAAAPLGALGLIGWTGRRARRHSRAAILFAAAFVVAVEAVQVFLRRQAADVNDALAGLAGAAAGVWIARRFLAHRTAEAMVPPRAVSWRALSLVVVWTGVLLAVHWRPFDFNADVDRLRDVVRGMSLVPFAGYWSGAELHVFSSLLAKIALALPFGAGASFVVRPGADRRRLWWASWMTLALCVFAAIEAGQVFLASRTPDPTDVLVGTAAAAAGLWIGQWLQGVVTLERGPSGHVAENGTIDSR